MKISEKKRAYQKEYYQRNRSKMLAYSKEYYWKNREDILAREKEYRRRVPRPSRADYYHKVRKMLLEKMGGKCLHCGETDACCLQIDHINGGGTQETRKIGNKGVYRKILKSDDWQKEYQLLCSNCNWRKREKNNELLWRH